MAKPRTLTAERLREVLNYDPETGVFRWIICLRRGKTGKQAGARRPNGYIQIGVDGRLYLAHRLAWLFVNSALPTHEIDHINGNRADNRIANLRAVTRRTNAQNLRGPRSDSTSGLLGVSPAYNKWAAFISTEGRSRNLGSFDTKEAAYAAYLDAKRRLHPGGTL